MIWERGTRGKRNAFLYSPSLSYPTIWKSTKMREDPTQAYKEKISVDTYNRKVS